MITLKGSMLVVAFATMMMVTSPIAGFAQGPGAGKAVNSAPRDRMAGAKESLKARFGFTDAQATTAIQKMQGTAKTFQPQFLALQNKYGSNPTPEQRQKMQREAIPLIAEISKKSNAILLSVATKEQRPKILAQIKAEQEQIAKMKSGAKP